LRIVTFNVHHGTVGRRGPVDPDQLGETCAGFDADVLALQEVDLGTIRTGGADLALAVARATGMQQLFGPSRRLPGGFYGNALLVRGRFDRWAVHRLPRRPRWRVWQERRTSLVAHALLDDGPLAVAATHLAVPRPISTRQQAHLTRIVAGLPRPAVLLGDLNREPHEVAPMAEALGFAAAAHDPTHPVKAPKLTIDHVLVSPGLAITGVEVRRTPMSDHRALLVDVERVPEPAADPDAIPDGPR